MANIQKQQEMANIQKQQEMANIQKQFKEDNNNKLNDDKDMGDTINFNGSIGQYVKEGNATIEHYYAQSVGASETSQSSASAPSADAGTGSATDAGAGTANHPAPEAQVELGNIAQLTNRQIIIMMTGLLNISLSPDYTNQKQLAQFLSRLTGRSMQSIRQSIMQLAKNGAETPQARKDTRIAADALEPFCKRIASRLRNGAEE